jgi:hypothetical protein
LVLFLAGVVRFFLSVEAVLWKKSGDPDSYLVAFFNLDDLCVLVLLVNAFYAAASADARWRRHTAGWDGMFEVVLFASWTHANATDVIDRQSALFNRLGLWRESWEAWRRRRNVDDVTGARLRIFLRFVSVSVGVVA